MLRRAVLMGALIAGAAAPAAQAQSTLVVQAAAAGHFGGFERMQVHFQCSAADATGAPTYLTRCSFGPLGAPIKEAVPFATGGGTVRAGYPYDLCVSATSHHATGPVTVSRCAPYNFLTGHVVIGT